MQNLSFQANRADPESGFEQYRELYSGGSTVESGPGHFHAELTALRLPRMLLFERRLSGVTHIRDTRRIARDGFDHVTLQLILSGEMMAETDDTIRAVRAGEIALFDNAQPRRTWTAGAHSLTVSLARDALAPGIRSRRISHGLVFGGEQARDLGAHVRAFGGGVAVAASKTDEAAVLMGAMLAEALGAAGTTSRANAAAFSAPRAYARVLAYIDRHLAERSLSIGAIARGCGLSRSALYRLFEEAGGVAEFVQRQRLLRLRRALTHADETRSVAMLAAEAGFASPAHANRRFRDAFGQTPQAFRLGGAQGAAIPTSWQAELG